MEWYNILMGVLGLIGTIGGIGGLVTLYHAKSNKDTIDLGNMKTMLDEAQAEREDLRREFDDFKRETHEYVEGIRGKCGALERRVDSLKAEVGRLKAAVFQGYRCRYPEKIQDCPVIKEYEKRQCEQCDNKEQEQTWGQ